MKNSCIEVSTIISLLLICDILLINSSNVTNTLRCPSKCTINGVNRNTFSRIKQDCPNMESFVKCSTSLWFVADGNLTISFDGDSSAQAINESLIPSSFNNFFYHHTQVIFHGNSSETKVNIRNACFRQDDCSRIFASKMAEQLFSYHYVDLEESIKPLIYDSLANTEIQYFTPNLRCAISNISTGISCNTTCYVLSTPKEEQRLCWLGTIVGLHIYTENPLPVPINTTITLSYNCNTRDPLCNGPETLQNVTEIVQNFFYNAPNAHILNSSIKHKIHSHFSILIFSILFSLFY